MKYDKLSEWILARLNKSLPMDNLKYQELITLFHVEKAAGN